MAEENKAAETEAPAPRPAKPRAEKAAAERAPAKAAAKPEKKATTAKAPRRPTLEPETKRLLAVRDTLDEARPRFTRQASYRYHRIGRWENWRRPRGQQSKQRRHYKYRSQIVRIGYRSPAATRGLTPSGFRPILVRTIADIARLDPIAEAAIIARTVGTKRRLVLEESARQKGVHVLNPIVTERGEA